MDSIIYLFLCCSAPIVHILSVSAVDIYVQLNCICTKYDPVYCVTLMITYIQCIICSLSGVFIYFCSAVICLCVIFQRLPLSPSVQEMGRHNMFVYVLKYFFCYLTLDLLFAEVLEK